MTGYLQFLYINSDMATNPGFHAEKTVEDIVLLFYEFGIDYQKSVKESTLLSQYKNCFSMVGLCLV